MNPRRRQSPDALRVNVILRSCPYGRFSDSGPCRRRLPDSREEAVALTPRAGVVDVDSGGPLTAAALSGILTRFPVRRTLQS